MIEIWDAIRIIKKNHCTYNEKCMDVCKYGKDRCVYDIAIKAVEKQLPMEIKEIHVDEYFCPACGSENNCNNRIVEHKYCPECGQRLIR